MKTNKNTKEEYKQTLLCGLAKLERGRKKRIFFAFTLSIAIGALCYLYTKLAGLSDKTLGPILFLTVLPYLLITEKYKLDIQKKVMKIFTSYFGNFSFCENECIPDHKLVESKLFTFTDNYAFTSFRGEINNKKTLVTISKLSQKDQATGKKEVTFKGLISMVIMPEFYQSQTIIMNNIIAQNIGGVPKLEGFENGVFSTNAQDAKNILTPQFMQWFNSLKTTFNSEKYAVSVHGNTLITAVYDENLKCFEYKSTYQKVHYSQNMQSIFEALEKVLEANHLEFPEPCELQED